MTRYARQTPLIGAAGQSRLAAARVLVVGAGGLGVPVIQYLAGAGVGRITLIDPDRVEETNLHRQPIYGPAIGQHKARAAATFACLLNAEVKVTPIIAALTPANAPELIAAADLILDCADSFAASYTLSDACRAAGKPLISASVLGLSGYVGGFCATAPSLRALFPDLPDGAATCATAGVLGPVVGMLGTLQAQLALAVLLDLRPSPLGQLIRWDLGTLTPTSFRFDAAPEPASHHPFIATTDLVATDRVIDLRPEAEAPLVAPQATRLPPEAIAALPPDPSRRTVFACRSGLRAWRAADRLGAAGPGAIALIADHGVPG